MMRTSTQLDYQEHVESLISVNLEGKYTALLVEDNEVNRIVANEVLTGLGFRLEQAENGAVAVEMCQKHHYDMIFMDIQMPVMGGVEATQLIRAFNQDVPIIALSAAVMKEDKEFSMASGMNGHLSKPIDKVALIQTVLNWLKQPLEEPSELKPNTADIRMDASHSIVSDKVSNKMELALLDADEMNSQRLNVDELLNVMNGSQSLVKRLLQKFQEGISQDMLVNFQNVELGSEDYRKHVHTFKGVCANLKMHRLHQLCLQVESVETEEDLQTLNHALIKSIEETREIVASFLEQ